MSGKERTGKDKANIYPSGSPFKRGEGNKEGRSLDVQAGAERGMTVF